MDYMESAVFVSNSSVLDIFCIDELSDVFEYESHIQPEDIINLATLIETFVLSNEVVIRDGPVTLSDTYDFDFPFTEKWISELSKNDVIVLESKHDCAANLLVNSVHEFGATTQKLLDELYQQVKPDKKEVEPPYRTWTEYAEAHDQGFEYFKYVADYSHDNLDLPNPDYSTMYDENEDDHDNVFDQLELKQVQLWDDQWKIMTKFLGMPFITSEWKKTLSETDRKTNLSYDLYTKMEKYFKDYFERFSKYLGPSSIRIPSMLSLVLQETKHIDEIPMVTMQVRERFKEFVLETTELEYQLRTAKNIFEQIEIMKLIENGYDNIAKKFIAPKTRIQSRIFDVVQSFDPKKMAIDTVKNLRQFKIEENGLLLIPGYYDLWKASGEVSQSLPLIKRVFGSQIDKDFLLKLQILSKKD